MMLINNSYWLYWDTQAKPTNYTGAERANGLVQLEKLVLLDKRGDDDDDDGIFLKQQD